MNKSVVLTVLATLAIIVGGVFLMAKSQNPGPNFPSLPANLEYFWGDGCPHCKNVADFMESWDKKDQVKIDKFEVWNNPKNTTLLEARYKYCQTPKTEMGVPLLFTQEGKCYSGDTPIIDFLKNLEL